MTEEMPGGTETDDVSPMFHFTTSYFSRINTAVYPLRQQVFYDFLFHMS